LQKLLSCVEVSREEQEFFLLASRSRAAVLLKADRTALRTAGGLPNDVNNGRWGSTFRTYLQQVATLPQ